MGVQVRHISAMWKQARGILLGIRARPSPRLWWDRGRKSPQLHGHRYDVEKSEKERLTQEMRKVRNVGTHVADMPRRPAIGTILVEMECIARHQIGDSNVSRVVNLYEKTYNSPIGASSHTTRDIPSQSGHE